MKQMLSLILIFYSIIVLFYILTYFFIIYHLARYSINSSLNQKILPLFVIVSALLLISNMLLFLSINWQELFTALPFSFNY